MVLLGGVETLTGPVVGAALFTLLQDWITRATPYWQAVLGVSVIALTSSFRKASWARCGSAVAQRRVRG